MAERLQVYKCEVCGNIVEVLHGARESWSAAASPWPSRSKGR